MKRVAAIVLLMLVESANPAFAFQPLVTDDTGTQGTGGNQIEAAFNWSRDTLPGEKEIARGVPLVYTRGITETLDLYVGSTYQRISASASPTERGWGNTAFGAKWRFYENEARKVSLALKPEIRLPVSESREARGLGAARTGYAAAFIVTQQTAFGAVHANLAAERLRHEDPAPAAAERGTRYRLSVAPVWDVSERWKVAFDTGIATNPDPAARRYLAYAELGAIYAPVKDLEIALGVIRNFRDGEVRTTQATLGLSWRFR
jgi:hypothetical protein